MGEQLIRLYRDVASPAWCRSCKADIVWMETAPAGRMMPMNAGAVAQGSEFDEATRRTVAFYRAADSHFVTCPNSEEHRKKR